MKNSTNETLLILLILIDETLDVELDFLLVSVTESSSEFSIQDLGREFYSTNILHRPRMCKQIRLTQSV